jgi:hypothetical protein
MTLAPGFGWFVVVGIAAQLVDRSFGTLYAVTASAFLVTLMLNFALWLQLGSFSLGICRRALPPSALGSSHLPSRPWDLCAA